VTTLNFGQSLGGVFQMAFTVEDLDAGMAEYTERLNVGPWFVSGPFVPAQGEYRGAPTDAELSLAVGYAGHMMFELIQQHNDSPSVYREVIAERGHGFHHWGVLTEDLDGEVARYAEMGCEVAFADLSPRGARVRYIDTLAMLPGMLEFIEYSPRLEAIYTNFYRASIGWDGVEPVRRA
jgi:hypothetical protein